MKHHILKKRLKKRGWHDEHIDHAIRTFIKAEEKKHPSLKKLDKSLYWIGLGISLLAAILIGFAFIPFYLALSTPTVILMLSLSGLCLGIMMDVFFREIDYMAHHHYILAGAYIPSISLITIFLAIRLGNIISRFLPAAKTHNPYLLAASYCVSFSLPHFIFKLIEDRKDGS